MRVLLTNTGAWGTGSAMVAEGVADELRRQQHQPLLFFHDAQVDTPDKEHYYSQPDRYHIWRFPLEREGLSIPSFPLMIADPNPRSGATALTYRDLSDGLLDFYFREARRELTEVVERFRPDIIECQHVWALASVANELGLRYTVTAHHSDQMGYRYDERMQAYANQAAAGARWVFAISGFVQEEVRSLYPGLQADKVVVLESGYDARVFRPAGVDRGQALRAVGIEDSSELPVITFSGKISRTKGVDILLRANRLLQRERKTLLLIAGTGKLETEFSAAERADFHHENVHFLGHHPQTIVAQLHNIAAVSVMPSRTEGFGLAGLEAMGCGTPVVATRCGGPESYVVGGLVPIENVEQLAEALLKVLALEPGKAQELREEALKAAQRYSWAEIVKRRLDYYRQALEQKT